MSVVVFGEAFVAYTDPRIDPAVPQLRDTVAFLAVVLLRQLELLLLHSSPELWAYTNTRIVSPAESGEEIPVE